MEMTGIDRPVAARRAGARSRPSGSALYALSFAAMAVIGCGGSSKSATTPTTPLPPPPAAVQFNTYIGTQGAQFKQDASSGVLPQSGIYTLSLDDAEKKFTWENATSGFYPDPGVLGGTFTAAAEFLDFTVKSFGGTSTPLTGANPEYALEIPGRAALLRPGDATTPLAFFVPSISAATATCQAVNSNAIFQFVTLPDPVNSIVSEPTLFGAQVAGPAFGSVTLTSAGANYTFSNYNTFYLDGTSAKPAALQTGVCAQTLAGAAVTVAADPTNNVPPSTIAIGPTGFFMLDQTLFQANASNVTYGSPAAIGVIQPASPVDVSSITTGKYSGFEFEPILEGVPDSNGSGLSTPITFPVAFSTSPAGSGELVGGVYANDDLSHPSLTDTTITFGAQDAKNNGLFTGAIVTVSDPNGVCAANGQGTLGTDSNGKPTCSFPAVIVAGNPENKFALFLIANDLVNGSPMGIYLFQQ